MLGFRVSVLGFGVGLRLRIGLWVRDGVRVFGQLFGLGVRVGAKP